MSLEASIQSLEKAIVKQIGLQEQIIEGQALILQRAQEASTKATKPTAKPAAKPAAKAAAKPAAEPAAPAAEPEAAVEPATAPEPTPPTNSYAGDDGFAKLRAEASAYMTVTDDAEKKDRAAKFGKLIEHCGGTLKGDPKGLPTVPEDRRPEFAGYIATLAKGEDLPEVFGDDDLLG